MKKGSVKNKVRSSIQVNNISSHIGLIAKYAKKSEREITDK